MEAANNDASVRSKLHIIPSYRRLPPDEIELTGTPGQSEQFGRITEVQGEQSPAGRNNSSRQAKIFQKQTLKSVLFHLIPVFLIIGLIVFIVLLSTPGHFWQATGKVCRPDGTFELHSPDYTSTPWDRSAIFSIDLRFGSYRFRTAKVPDIFWDVLVGRGLQTIFAIINYRIFTRALIRSMESSSVSTDIFEAITLQNNTIAGIWKLLKHQRKVSSRFDASMICIILSSIFTLALPTWLSAMTGYTAEISAFVQDSNDNLIPITDFLPYIYTIHDGKRLGEPYTDDYRIVIGWYDDEGTVVALDDNGYLCKEAFFRPLLGTWTWTGGNNTACHLFWETSNYTSINGFLGQNETESTFVLPNGTSVTLPAPSLNISADIVLYDYYYDYSAEYGRPLSDAAAKSYWAYNPYGSSWISNITHDAPFNISHPMFYSAASNTAYNLSQIEDNALCLQSHEVRYQWGFFFFLLYIFLVTLLVWTIMMYGLFLDSYWNSRLDGAGRQMGFKRAVLDLSETRREYVKSEDITMYSNSQISSVVKDSRMDFRGIAKLRQTRWEARS